MCGRIYRLKSGKKFIDEGHKVVGIDDLSGGNIKNIPDEVDFYNIDLVDTAQLSKSPSDCEIILHLAGQSSGEISFNNPIDDLEKYYFNAKFDPLRD